MPDLLIELFSEEIPARMQNRAAEDLKKKVTEGLVEAGLIKSSFGESISLRRRDPEDFVRMMSRILRTRDFPSVR